MPSKPNLLIALFICFCGCQPKTDSIVHVTSRSDQQQQIIINEKGTILKSRFNPPTDFKRKIVDTNSFAYFLRNLKLKPSGTVVQYFDGNYKYADVYEAVLDQTIGNRDLHQCADAVMRLRADYLRSQKRYDDIHFNFTNGFNAEYSKWKQGRRIAVKGNNVYWTNKGTASESDASYWKYLEMVFSYAGTLSLSKELKTVAIEEMKIGDVFIYGGSPGHAIIVVDMCEDPKTGKKLFMLAQSYMPAQQTQILKNSKNAEISPWYSMDFGDELFTPEWSFSRDELKGF